MKKYLAIINPAAGGGRCGKLASRALDRLRESGLVVDVVQTQKAGDASELARQAWNRGVRHFLAGGGDGTSYEIVNGLFPDAAANERASLGFLPLGTGNSFLRDFSSKGLEHALEAITIGRSRPCDILKLRHRSGTLYYMNLLSVGFTAEAGQLTNGRFKALGELGYLLAILICWLRLHYPTYPLKLDTKQVDGRACTYLTFSNSRYTGGKLMIAPFANTADGLIETTRVAPIGRWDFARTFPKIFSGAHMRHPLISHAPARKVEFELPSPIDIMIDGEVIHCHPQSIEVLPSVLDVMV